MLYTFHRNEYPSPFAYLYASFTREIRGVKRRLDGDRIIVGSMPGKKDDFSKFNFKLGREELPLSPVDGIRGKNLSFSSSCMIVTRHSFACDSFLSPSFFFSLLPTGQLFFLDRSCNTRVLASFRAYVVKVSIANPVPIHFPPD